MDKIPLIVVANLYPTEKKPYFGTFVKNVYENLDVDLFDKKKLVLPEYGSGLKGYIKFYYYCFLELIKYKGVVYIHYVSHSAFPVLIARLFNKNLELILNYHGSDAFSEKNESNYKSLLKRWVCKYSNRVGRLIVVPSDYFKCKIEKSYSIDSSKIIVSPSGGFDKSVFYPTKNSPSFSKKRFIFASRMISGKGCILAAKTTLALAKSHPNATFCFVGDGPEQNTVKDILKELIITNRCEVRGSMNQLDLADQFRQSTFFLFPSMREGESLGLVIVEAMACGAIPLAIDQGALREILGNDSHILTSEKDTFTELVLSVSQKNDHDLEVLRARLLSRANRYERSIVMSDLSSTINKAVRTRTNA
jgi:glycosyltransferase involved in cell wall biosynthesis